MALKPNGRRPVGLFQVRRLDSDFQVAEWGFFMDPDAVWPGCFHAAAQYLLSFAFNTVGVHRIEARVVVDNEAASRALELGATPEGRLRQGLHRNGRYWDQYLYTLLRSDWSRRLTSARTRTLRRGRRGRFSRDEPITTLRLPHGVSPRVVDVRSPLTIVRIVRQPQSPVDRLLRSSVPGSGETTS